MGLTISQTVTLVSKQIQFAKDIPPTIHRPEWIDAIMMIYGQKKSSTKE